MKKEDISEKDEIQIVLDSYNDLFSVFDPRAYSQKVLSDDFLGACKIAAVDKKEGFELKFLMAKRKRDKALELIIKKRLRNHFLRHYQIKKKDIRKIRKIGFLWCLFGGMAMFLGAYLSDYIHSNIANATLWSRLILIMLEPAGWWLFWEGLAKIFIEAKKELPDYGFYKKMTQAYIYFEDC